MTQNYCRSAVTFPHTFSDTKHKTCFGCFAALQKPNPATHNAHKEKGFTLIELLVVVLIIGILAAVALPQYQKTVERSRAAQMFISGKSLLDTIQRYHLENNEYPTTFDQLDIGFSLQGEKMYEGYQIGRINQYYTLFLRPKGALVDRDFKPGGVEDLSHRYVMVFCAEDSSVWCGAGVSTQTASQKQNDQKLCKSLGGVQGTPPTSCTAGVRDTFFKIN